MAGACPMCGSRVSVLPGLLWLRGRRDAGIAPAAPAAAAARAPSTPEAAFAGEVDDSYAGEGDFALTQE